MLENIIVLDFIKIKLLKLNYVIHLFDPTIFIIEDKQPLCGCHLEDNVYFLGTSVGESVVGTARPVQVLLFFSIVLIMHPEVVV